MKTLKPIPRSWAEPWKVKSIEAIRMTTLSERETALCEAGWNTFLLRSEDVYIDLLTDSGTNAMSDRQWAAMMTGDEAYAGSRDYFDLERAMHEVYGYRHLIPTHQGRGAEHILSQLMIEKGQIVPGNMYFTTTRFHQEYAGGIFADIIVDQAHDADDEFPFKGNVDISKLEMLVHTHGRRGIAYVSHEANVNMAGGQPFSMENLRELRHFCVRHGIPIFLDATRVCENAYFIKTREAGYREKTIGEIVREICSLTDGCTVSGKKDCLVNTGGFLAVNDDTLAERARNMVVCFEGLHTYGGMAGRDMAAMAVGMREAIAYDHIRARVEQVRYLARKIEEFGIPIVKPCGGHAVYLNAKRILPHLDQEEFPAQRLAGEIYLEAGIRSMERGIVSAGRDSSGEHHKPSLELVRLTIPRRVYTQAHMDVVSEAVARVYERAEEIRGLRMVHEPASLRFFQARFEAL